MRSKSNKTPVKKRLTFSSLMESNKFVFVFALAVSFICWCGISIYQTPVIEKVFSNLTVNIDESLPKNSGLEIFGKKDFTVDVTVKGFSYIVNDPEFKEHNLAVTASCSAVAAAGTYDLPLTVSVTGTSKEIEVTRMSVQSIRVNFDERVTKSFGLVEDIAELDGYSVAEGFVRENPRLSTDALKLSGPAREMLKITALKAHIELNKELKASESFEADIIAESAAGTVDLTNFTFDLKEPVYITIPVKKIVKFSTAVNFTGMPKVYGGDGIKYSVDPSEIELSLAAESSDAPAHTKDDKFFVGIIDFSVIDNKANRIVLENDYPELENESFTVTVDMSAMSKKRLDVPVDMSSVDLPHNVRVLSSSVENVAVIGPAKSLKALDRTAAYAVPELKGVSLTSGKHSVPAKIVFRTITDSWVFGKYEMEISVG